jgi:RHS repeat-associated protein
VRKEVVPPPREDGTQPPVRVVGYLWDGVTLALETDSVRGARAFVHTPGSYEPLLQAEQGEVFAYVNDHLGTPKELIGADGTVAWAAAHSAYGKIVAQASDRSRPVESPFRLLGQYFDPETGLALAWHRYFDADTGRWISPDPLGLAGGRGVFAFNGSPTGAVDPTWLACPLGKSAKLKDHYVRHKNISRMRSV